MKRVFGLCLLLFVSSAFGQDIPADITKKEYEAPDTGNQIWVYYPAGTKAASLPCVLISVAGTRMFHGMGLAEGDVLEHLPYVKAGFAVVAYGLSGPWPEQVSESALAVSIKAYMKSEGGLHDAVAALQTAKAHHPFIDTSRVYAVGHSSAGVVALNLVQRSAKFRGCIAYAAVGDLEERMGNTSIDQIESAIPGFRKFIQDNSPARHADKVQCPVLIFNAKDDDNVSADSVAAYVGKLKQAGKTVKHVEVATGGHYDSMLKEGIPLGIEWIKAREAAAQ